MHGHEFLKVKAKQRGYNLPWITVFWDMTLHQLASCCWCSGGASSFHLEGSSIIISCLGALFALYRESVLSEIVIGRQKRKGVLWWAEP